MSRSLILLLILLLVWSAPSFAEDTCTSMANYAKITMELRQGGAPILDVLKTAKGIGDAEPFAIYIVENAYSQPLFNTLKMKKQITTEYETEIYLWCRKGMRIPR